MTIWNMNVPAGSEIKISRTCDVDEGGRHGIRLQIDFPPGVKYEPVADRLYDRINERLRTGEPIALHFQVNAKGG